MYLWLPPPAVLCLHILQQLSLSAWLHAASICQAFMSFTSQRSLLCLAAWGKVAPPPQLDQPALHPHSSTWLQADTQFQPLAQQLLERHKPELCSQPPEARDIRMVCPSRGGVSVGGGGGGEERLSWPDVSRVPAPSCPFVICRMQYPDLHTCTAPGARNSGTC